MPTVAWSEASPQTLFLWRVVEAQHVVSTMLLVDSVAEQLVLEQLLDDSKPAVREGQGLHYLLFTPFRYPAPPGGSRFRAEFRPGVFYGADVLRTACAELGYWRWRFLLGSPALPQLEPVAQTAFRVSVSGATIDLREPPFVSRRAEWTDPRSYAACQAFADTARAGGVEIIRYESVRDPEHGGCAAALSPTLFRSRVPLEQERWFLAVTRERVRWWRDGGPEERTGVDFDTAGWVAA